MDIQINEKDYCKLEVKYEADLDQINSKKDEVLSLFKKAPVPGFRKGKASLEVIKVHYKKQIEESLKRALAEEAFHNTMFEKNIKPLGQPDFTSILLQNNKFNCEFLISKKPDFELAQYKDFEIPRPAPAFSLDDVTEKMLEELRVQHGEMVAFSEDDVVDYGDKIVASYNGFIDGVKDDQISSDGELINVGTNPIKNFDDSIIGMKVGETREFDVVVPETSIASYANKTVHFSLSVSAATKINKAPLDDEFAKKFGKNSFQELREAVVSVANGKLEENKRASLTAQISARLNQSHDFQVPHWLALSEAQYLASNAKKDWATLSQEDMNSFLGLANNNVKLALILDKIRENEPEAQLSDQEVIEMIKSNIAKSGVSSDEVLQNMSKSGYLQILVTRLRDENTLDFILKNSKITE